jgi:hypothetical protein
MVNLWSKYCKEICFVLNNNVVEKDWTKLMNYLYSYPTDS